MRLPFELPGLVFISHYLDVIAHACHAFSMRGDANRFLCHFLGTGVAAQNYDAVVVGIDADVQQCTHVFIGQFCLDLGCDRRILDEGQRMFAIHVLRISGNGSEQDADGEQAGCDFSFHDLSFH